MVLFVGTRGDAGGVSVGERRAAPGKPESTAKDFNARTMRRTGEGGTLGVRRRLFAVGVGLGVGVGG